MMKQPKYSPYRKTTVDLYLAAGWSDIFPILKNGTTWQAQLDKSPPATGYTGYDAKVADAKQHAKWIRSLGDAKGANIAWHVQDGYLVVDVDQYNAKRGADLLADLTTEAGVPLPATIRSTSRGADLSTGGKFVFRLPDGVDSRKVAWRSNPKPGIELLHAGHRYMVVGPSRNPHNGHKAEIWYRNNTEPLKIGQVPNLDEAATLPDEWMSVLSYSDRERNDLSRSGMTDDAKIQWLNGKDVAADEICDKMRKVLDKCIDFLAETEEGVNAAHDAMINAQWQIINLTNEGHRGALEALEEYKEAWVDELNAGKHSYRSDGMAMGEWRRGLYEAINKTLGTSDKQAQEMEACFCGTGAVEPDSALRPAKTSGFDYPADVHGFARRFVDMWGEHVRWSDGYAPKLAWFVWSKSGWTNEGALFRIRRMIEELGRIWEAEARAVMDAAKEKAAQQKAKGKPDKAEDAAANDEVKAAEGYWKSVRQTLSMKGMADILELASQYPSIYVKAERFDSNDNLLGCANGVLELNPEGVLFRDARRGDLTTIHTGIDYDPDATSAMWKDYLDTFVPDLEVRDYLQEFLGYSLLGGNSKRHIAFFWGKTSSGKSTLSEVIQAALGSKYAGPFNLSVFRANQDDKPRTDIADALPMRIVFASEASAAWTLHADQVKRIVGGEKIPARRPYAPEQMMRRPDFVPIISTNDAPRIAMFDSATDRRLVVFPFNQMAAQSKREARAGQAVEDSDASSRMQNDLETRQAVLAWLVDGYVRFAARGRNFPELPMAMVQAKQAFTKGISQMQEFLDECCEFGEPADYKALVTDMHATYRSWRKTCGGESTEREMSLTIFGTSLKDRADLDEKRVRNPDSDGKDNKVRLMRGIRIKTEWMERMAGEHSFNSLSR